MLSETGWRLLDAAVDEPTIGELAERLSKSAGYISQTVQALRDRQLVVVEADGRSKRVSPAGTAVFDQFQTLAAAHSHIDFPALLSPTVLRVCWFLASPTRVAEITPYLTVGRSRVYQILQTLQQRGLVREDDQEYALLDDLDGLHDLAVAAVRHEHRVQLREAAPQARLRWAAPHEAIATVDATAAGDDEALDEHEEWTLTGLPQFAEYDLEFIQGQAPAYYWSELAEPSATEAADTTQRDHEARASSGSLSPEGLICHTLLLDAGPRRAGYAALLAAAAPIETDRLRRLGRYYGVADLIDGLCRFRSLPPEERTREAVAPFPDQDRFAALAAQYEVDT